MQNTWLENRLKKYIDEKTAGGGGSGLPEVTSADNGKVLGVDDGEWKAVEPSSDVLVCNFTNVEQSVIDKTFIDLYEAWLSHKVILLNQTFNDEPEFFYYPMTLGILKQTDSGYFATFYCIGSGTSINHLDFFNSEPDEYMFVD